MCIVTMVGLDDHLKDPLYANWVRNTLALKIVNSVLQPYVYGEVVNLHKSIISRCPAGLTCGSCSWRQASSCPNNFCNIIRNEIEYYYRHRNPSFDNTNARDWKSDAWEVAKCFMPKGYRECTSSDADFSAIVNIVINCKAFDELVWCDLDQPENIFSEARKMRNHLMHSDEQKIAESALQTNLDLLVCILNDFKTIPPNSPDAKEKLTKLKAGKLQITLDEVLEVREQLLQARWATREFVDGQLAKLRQEIQGTGTFWKVQQHKLIGNFVKGCKYSLVKTMERHINKVRPDSHHEWNLSIFLDKLKVILGIKSLSQAHRRLLYPEDGNAVDINDWDMFLLCHVLSIDSVFELDNNEKTYIQEIKNFRDRILTNQDKIAEEDLKVLAEFLEEPLKHEIINIYDGEDINDDAVKLHTILTFWRQEEENMENKQISTKAVQEEGKNAARIEELESKLELLYELLGNKTDMGSKPEGHDQGIETNVQVKPKHCDKKEEEQVQDNMTSEDEAKNIFLANGGRNDFCEKLHVKTGKPIKGSIILKVTCESIKDLVRFWHSCTDGSALRALSKVRDDYRNFLGCDTLDFDIILTKKEVNRCMDHLIDRLSSRIPDISVLEKVLGTQTLLETVPASVEAEDTSKEKIHILTEESDREVSEDAQQIGKEGTTLGEIFKHTRVSLEEVHDVSEDVHDVPEEKRNVPEEMHDVPEEIRDVLEEMHDVPEKMRDVPEEMHDVPKEIRDVPEEMHDVPEEIRNVPKEMHNVRKEIHDVPGGRKGLLEEDRSATMSDLESRFRDPQYANWVKNALALEIANEVFKPYVVQEISNVHALILRKCPSGATCRLCDIKEVEKCPKKFCTVIKREIKDGHRFSNPSFNITNAKKWVADSWEIAKCYMPPIQRNQFCTPSDADFSAVLNIIINNTHFAGLVSCDLGRRWNIFEEAREMRNKVMHLSHYKVSETDFQSNVELLVKLVNDFKTQLPNSLEAIEKLDELKRGELLISLQDEQDAHEQAAHALWEERDKAKEEIRKYAELKIQEIGQTFAAKGFQSRVKANFIKGCKHSLVKLAKSHIDDLKPENIPQDRWTLNEFLKRIQFTPDMGWLPDRRKLLLYPDHGEASDVSNWDLFLLCHILSSEKHIPPPNNLLIYVQELQTMRDKILDNPSDVSVKDLEELTNCLDEPLKSEVKGIFMDSSDYRIDPLQLQQTLQSWRQDDDYMAHTNVSKRDLSERSQLAKQIEELFKKQKEMQEQMRQFEEKLKMGSLADNEADGVSDSIETEIEIKPKYCTREEKEKLQNNIIIKNGKENIAIGQGGADHFQTELNLESLQPAKGSIILKVTCKSVNDLLLFWESCMNGKALRALSKIRDDYRQFLQCNTLDFDIVLTKKEVNRCMNQLVERLSSKLLDERFSKVQEKATTLKIKVEDSDMEERKREEELSSEMSQKRTAEDEPIMPSISAAKEGVKRGEENVVMLMTSLMEPDIPEKTEREEYISEDTKKPSLDVHAQGPSGQGALKKGTKYSEYDATRLVKFLEEIAENFEEGKISVIKEYLVQLIQHSKDRDKEAFEKVIMKFTEATKFRSGISVSLMKQTFRGFRMILTEPEFGDLVAAKVEEIEKQEELKGGAESKAWQIDPKISAEDIPVGDKIAKEPSKTSGKLGEGAGTSKGPEYHVTDKDVSFGSKLSPVTDDVSFSKPDLFKSKKEEMTTVDKETKSMESMSFKQKPGSPGSLDATATSPAPKS